MVKQQSRGQFSRKEESLKEKRAKRRKSGGKLPALTNPCSRSHHPHLQLFPSSSEPWLVDSEIWESKERKGVKYMIQKS